MQDGKLFEIKQLLEQIKKQATKNKTTATKLTSVTKIDHFPIDVDEFIVNTRSQLHKLHSEDQFEEVKFECQCMIDQLLEEECKLDKTQTRLRRRKKHDRQPSITEQMVSPRGLLIPLQLKDQNIKEITKFEIKDPPPEVEVLDFLNEKVKQMKNQIMESLRKNNQSQIDYSSLIEVEEKIEQFKQNQIYVDENVEVYVIKKNPNISINDLRTAIYNQVNKENIL
ncbi:hypothetical protein pb186bvf_016824 [Paramecium bursaria]